VTSRLGTGISKSFFYGVHSPVSLPALCTCTCKSYSSGEEHQWATAGQEEDEGEERKTFHLDLSLSFNSIPIQEDLINAQPIVGVPEEKEEKCLWGPLRSGDIDNSPSLVGMPEEG
jgi:hypothetical protein